MAEWRDNGKGNDSLPARSNRLYSDRGAALQSAAQSGSYAIAQLLLKRGANINSLGPESTIYGRTALETAAMYGRLDIVQLFLNEGADTNLSSKNRYASALRIAKNDCFEPNTINTKSPKRSKKVSYASAKKPDTNTGLIPG